MNGPSFEQPRAIHPVMATGLVRVVEAASRMNIPFQRLNAIQFDAPWQRKNVR